MPICPMCNGEKTITLPVEKVPAGFSREVHCITCGGAGEITEKLKSELATTNSMLKALKRGVGGIEDEPTDTVLRMLTDFMINEGTEFSIKKACDALQSLSETALFFKKHLERRSPSNTS